MTERNIGLEILDGIREIRAFQKSTADKKRQIALVYRKLHIDEQGSDREYWLSQPPSARLAALEEIRREVHGWNLGEEPGIEKVVTIVRLNKSGSPENSGNEE